MFTKTKTPQFNKNKAGRSKYSKKWRKKNHLKKLVKLYQRCKEINLLLTKTHHQCPWNVVLLFSEGMRVKGEGWFSGEVMTTLFVFVFNKFG